jgi:flavin-dependent dehydrogenase
VVIAGGGPAGAAAAITLGAAGLKVLVVNRKRRQPAFGEILPPQAVPVIDKLSLTGVLDAPDGPALSCPGICSSFNRQSIAMKRTYRKSDGAGYGWVLDRARFEALMIDRARACGARCLEDAHLHRFERTGGQRWRITAIHGHRLFETTANVIVDATGRPAVVARRLGARLVRQGRRIAVASVCKTVAALSPADSQLIVERDGANWWYSVRVPNGDLHVALHVPRLPGRKKADLVRLLGDGPPRRGWTKARMQRLFGAWPPTSVQMLDAGTSCIDPMIGDSWLTIGDAATAFDPLSGQGLNNAMTSGIVAARAIHDYLNGRMYALKIYAAAMRWTHRRSALQLTRLYRQVAVPNLKVSSTV